MLNQRANFRVDNFVIAAAARGFFGQVDTTMFVEFVQPIDSIFGQIEGQAQGLVIQSAHFSEVVFINVILGGDWLEGELDERGSFLAGDGNTQVLGTLAGKGALSNKHKGGKVIVKVDEPSYLIGIVSLTPRIDYSQGNNWDIHLETMDDLHKPALDQIGFQELITEQMAWWNTHYDLGSGTWITRSAGKQPAWLNYMTNVNKTYGNFAIENNEMFMTLNRRYEMVLEDPEVSIDDLTTYIHPEKYNNIFAQTEIDAQNFWVQIGVDIEARRKLSAKVMPNL